MGQSFILINGIKCYAPQFAAANSDYPAEAFELLYKVEDTNFWFVNRNKIIQHLFKKYLGINENSVLEIGAGTGFVLKGLQNNFSNYQLEGSEIHLEGINLQKNACLKFNFFKWTLLIYPLKTSIMQLVPLMFWNIQKQMKK